MPNKTVVLVHGFRGAPAGLEAIAQYLRNTGYKVYIPAIPPFAGAPRLPEYTADAYSTYLAQYLAKQKLDHPVLVGHSMGSVIVAAFAKAYPGLIDSRIILLSPLATRPILPFRLISPLAAIVPRRLVDYITTRYLFVPKDRRRFRQTMDITHRCSSDHPPRATEIARATKFSVSHSVLDFITNQKVFLIAGENDRLVGRKNLEHLSQQIPAKLELIPNSGHLHNYEEPEKTAQLILDFLATK